MRKGGRKKAPPVKPVNPSLPEETYIYLQKLTKTGAHGRTPSEVARVLIWDQIKFLIREGVIDWVKPDGDGD